MIREPTQLVQPNEDITVELEPELITIPDPLPLLNESDDFIRHDLAEIVGAESLVEYLIKSQVISRMVSTIDSLTSRQVVPQINLVKSADGKLVVDADGDGAGKRGRGKKVIIDRRIAEFESIRGRGA